MTTRDALLDVTARLYAEHGWRGTTTRRIAAAAGVNEVTLFRQFGSKEQLLLEAIDHASSGRAPSLPAIPHLLSQELTTWAVAHHQLIAEQSGLIRSCLAEWEERPVLGPQACRGGVAALADGVRYLTLARERRRIGPDGSIEAAMTMLVHSVFMDAMTRDMMPGNHAGSPPESIAQFVDVLLRSLAAVELA